MPKLFHITTYGCQMNHSDSERIRAVLSNSPDFELTPDQNQADIIILNLCSVRQSAINRIWSKIHNNKQKKIMILTGCILPTDRKKFSRAHTYILNIDDIANWPSKILHKLESNNKKIIAPKAPKKINHNYLSITPQYSFSFKAFVPIMTGCNNFCSYCAVPYTRGREVSRSPEDIISEIQNLIDNNYREITLLGQNVNSYKAQNKKGEIIDFPTLLKSIDNLEGDFWLNFVSSHPKDLSDELIKCYDKPHHITPHLHLALQSGSNKIIHAMNRHYTARHFLDLTHKLRSINPTISITTDIIVGFPGETYWDFLKTIRIVKKIKFDMIYSAQFSPRPDTVACKMKDDVPKRVKKSREKKLISILHKHSLAKNKKLIGTNQKILIDKFDKQKNTLLGHTNQLKHVKIDHTHLDPSSLVGKFIQVNIAKASASNLSGEYKI